MKLLDNGTVLLTPREFRDLLEYSTTLPTGTTPGKVWKRRVPWWAKPEDAQWMRGCFGVPYPEGHEHHGQIPIGWRPIRIQGQPPRWPANVKVPPRDLEVPV